MYTSLFGFLTFVIFWKFKFKFWHHLESCLRGHDKRQSYVHHFQLSCWSLPTLWLVFVLSVKPSRTADSADTFLQVHQPFPIVVSFSFNIYYCVFNNMKGLLQYDYKSCFSDMLWSNCLPAGSVTDAAKPFFLDCVCSL